VGGAIKYGGTEVDRLLADGAALEGLRATGISPSAKVTVVHDLSLDSRDQQAFVERELQGAGYSVKGSSTATGAIIIHARKTLVLDQKTITVERHLVETIMEATGVGYASGVIEVTARAGTKTVPIGLFPAKGRT
jgi:predicted homoserine dehydrogenase-like protein